MPNIVVKVKVGVPSAKELEDRLKGAKFRKFLDDVAKDMGDQARVNIRKFGAPGGRWPTLSGFNERVQRKKAAKAAIKDGGDTAGNRRRAKTDTKFSKHSGYAREKERDRDAGRIPYGPADRLVRTGTLRESMAGVVMLDRNRVEMIALGDHGDGMTNQELFVAHATGEGNLPVRNPAEDMNNFLERTKRRLRDLLAARIPPENRGT